MEDPGFSPVERKQEKIWPVYLRTQAGCGHTALDAKPSAESTCGYVCFGRGWFYRETIQRFEKKEKDALEKVNT